MPITDVISNPHDFTLTIVADYAVPVQRLWDAYADPRQIERFWGPVGWPATFTRHDMAVGGRTHYYMTGPDGTRQHGWFRYLDVARNSHFEVEDGFSDERDAPDSKMPTMHMVFSFTATDAGSRCTSKTTFASLDAMDKLVKMGMVEGTRSAMSQIDDVLADLRSYAASMPTTAQLLNDTQVRVTRLVRGTTAQVWRAYHDASMMQRWLLGPDGWTMPVCEIAMNVGDAYRYEWAAADGSQRFGVEGELLESAEPYRSVTSERMTGTVGPSTRNDLTLVPATGGTLLSLIITYPSKELRDTILATGMTTGMEAAYARLEQDLQSGSYGSE